MKEILMLMSHPKMSAAQYEGTVRDLEAAGLGSIPERLYHVAAPNGEGWHVTDVWESEEAFNKFAETMVPIVIKHAGTAVEPIILPVHNIIIP
ncbi:MAG: hypothetical protein ACR2MT_01125 [Aurantibacter sp.]